MSALVVPGSEGVVVSGGLGVVGGRLARGVPFMSGRRDVPLFVHGEREREWGAWCWLDRSLVVVERLGSVGGLGGHVEALPSTAAAAAGGSAAANTAAEAAAAAAGGGVGGLHVCLGPLLVGVGGDVNPLCPAGRRAHPTVPGGLAHVSAHLRHTRVDVGVLEGVSWPVVAAALLLEEVRCEAVYLGDRPWDAPYLRASALLWSLPGGGDRRWGAAYVGVSVLGRVCSGVLRVGDVRGVREEVVGVLGAGCVGELEGVCAGVLGLVDGDTQGLVGLGERLVGVVGDVPGYAVFTDPCAARTHGLRAPRAPTTRTRTRTTTRTRTRIGIGVRARGSRIRATRTRIGVRGRAGIGVRTHPPTPVPPVRAVVPALPVRAVVMTVMLLLVQPVPAPVLLVVVLVVWWVWGRFWSGGTP